MERELQGGVCGDECGLGKTLEMCHLLMAATRYWLQRADSTGDETLRPTLLTLILCPASIKHQTYAELRRTSGELASESTCWIANLRYPAKKSGVTYTRLDRDFPVWTSNDAHYNVVIMTYNEFSRSGDRDDLAGLLSVLS